MQRTMPLFVVLTASMFLCGCGSGGIEPGIPSGGDTSKVSDPMAGVKLHPMKPGANKAGSTK